MPGKWLRGRVSTPSRHWPGLTSKEGPGKARPALRDESAGRLRRLARSRLVRAIALCVLLLALTLGVTYWRLAATTASYPGTHFNQGHNAVWLEHDWVGEPHTDADYAALAAALAREQIGYVFVHVGPLDSDGTIPADRAPYAAAFVAALHDDLPGVRILAWIGQEEAASGLPADQVVALADPDVRQQIADTARSFVTVGFDGVHYDIEPIENNSITFVELLDTTRAALPPGAMISVAAEKWAPNAHVASWAYALGKGGSWWTTYYYATVAQHVDQLVVMAYNTGMPTGDLYSLLVKQETTNIVTAAQTVPHPPQVLIGLPTYTDDGPFFHANAETIGNGLAGVTAGLDNMNETHAFSGVALYRFGTTTDAEWSTYDHLWLGK